jgi:hypothetical protein
LSESEGLSPAGRSGGRSGATRDRSLWLATLGLGSIALVLSRWAVRPPVADDYDSANFLLGMARYDLARFQPQFPGYPVYVAIGAALHRLGLSTLAAATGISSVAAGVSGLGLAILAERLGGLRAAQVVLALQLVAWLPWLLGSGALSDGLGVSLAIASFALLLARTPRPFWSGAVGGLTLGVRLSYWPLMLSLAALAFLRRRQAPAHRGPRDRSTSPACGGGSRRGRRWRYLFRRHTGGDELAALLSGFAIGLLLWLVPFIWVVGPGNLVHLGQVHLTGHFNQWGGTIVTKPHLGARFWAFLQDLAYDGLAPSPWAFPALAGAAGLQGAWLRFRRPEALGRLPWRPLALVLAPYALWAFFAQNVLEQPRHVLPLLEGLLLFLGLFLADNWFLAAAIIALMAAVSLPLALERRRLPPAAAQAASWVATHEPVGNTMVAGTRSARFFREAADRAGSPGQPAFQVREDAWLSGLLGELARVDRLPGVLLITSEVDLHSGEGPRQPLPAQWQIEPGATFCRDARIDRFQPCLSLSQLTWRPR